MRTQANWSIGPNWPLPRTRSVFHRAGRFLRSVRIVDARARACRSAANFCFAIHSLLAKIKCTARRTFRLAFDCPPQIFCRFLKSIFGFLHSGRQHSPSKPGTHAKRVPPRRSRSPFCEPDGRGSTRSVSHRAGHVLRSVSRADARGHAYRSVAFFACESAAQSKTRKDTSTVL